MSWHPEVLPPKALALAGRLASLPSLDRWYLAGGTALALHKGHRISVDFDFFSGDEELDPSGRQKLKASLEGLGRYVTRDERDGTLHAVIDGVETSFLRYRYPLIRKTRRFKGLRLASIEDIALMKIGAIIGRGSRKDFRDLREILRSMRLGPLLRLASRKFPDAEDFVFQASKALVFFEDAEREPEPRLLRPAPWEEVKRFFQTEVPIVFRALELK